MTLDQTLLFAILAATLALFIWNRWRYDLVALGALLASTLAGLVPAQDAFSGLGHPAVITVAAVLVLSRGLLNAGVVDAIARRLTRVTDKPWLQVCVLSGIVALCSGFMNNVGALALFMPVAIWMSRKSGRSPSFLLMPIAFASLLGGTLTMIGTPPNIIISGYRADVGTEPFAMFEFFPVGIAITLAGVAFIGLLGWRLTPRRDRAAAPEELFEISAYVTEVRIPADSKYAGDTLHSLLRDASEDAEVMVIALIRDGRRVDLPSTYRVLRGDDILLVEADSESLTRLVEGGALELAATARESDGDSAEDGEDEGSAAAQVPVLAEAIVTPNSPLVGTTASALALRERHNANILAVARQGHRLQQRLGKIRFAAGDILLVQANEDSLQTTLNSLGCLPLASRGLRLPGTRSLVLASGIFIAALALIGVELLPAATALVLAALVMVLTAIVPAGDIYKSIDMPVIVLLAAMLPVGTALETTGGSTLIANGLLALGQSLPPAATLALLMAAVMLLSNVVNNAAAAVLAAPVAVSIAAGLDATVDPFLMAVAIGASCAFLTPIGHQSNTLVMTPGGYRFGDYWPMGLPLSLLVIAAGVPAILAVWPL